MFGSLNTVSTGLATSSQATDTINKNIANQNTEGYVKETVSTGEIGQVKPGTGGGVLIDEVIRNANDLLYASLVGETTSLSYHDELSEILGSLEDIFAETKDAGFSVDLDAYFQSLEDLKSEPNNASFQDQLITNALNLVETMQSLYSQVELYEKKLESDLKAQVRDINEITSAIANINNLLGMSSVDQLELLDKRDLLEKQLAEIVDIEVSKDYGIYELKIGGTTAVINNGSRDFSYEEEHVAQVDRFESGDFALNAAATNPNDKLIYNLNGHHEVEIKYGEVVNGQTVDETNILELLAFKINNDSEMSKTVTASISHTGSLEITANEAGLDGTFTSFIQHFTDVDANNQYEASVVKKSEKESIDATSQAYIQSYDEKVDVSGGSAFAIIQNLDSTSASNTIQSIKDSLDAFASTLIDMSSSYVQNPDGSFIYGETALSNSGEVYTNSIPIGLFSGTSVKNMEFNKQAVHTLDQKDYDYLVSMTTKNDILFNGVGQESANGDYDILAGNTVGTSFSTFFQAFKIELSREKENNSTILETQTAVSMSLINSYDKLARVDSDEEMMSLLQYQASYEANAKLATILQEMIATTLNMVDR